MHLSRDRVQVEIAGLQVVWPGVKVFLCLWHVCHVCVNIYIYIYKNSLFVQEL